MRPDIAHYAGREQSYVKHYLLDDYLVALVHKVAGAYDHIVYVDGFSGPWNASGENFEDTSFGIALQALRSAKSAWKEHGRDVRMTAHLVEKRQGAFRDLQTVPARYPDIDVVPHHGSFIDLAGGIASRIPPTAFAFILIDPKGWRIDMRKIRPLLQLPHCEVLFNFMFEFINRAASMSDPRTAEGLQALIPVGSWRQELSRADTPEGRKRVLIDAFAETLCSFGGFTFVAETPVLRPVKDRIIYSLIYATRASKGIEVFRDSQIKTLHKQTEVRGSTKLALSAAKSGQVEAFTQGEMAPSETESFLTAEKAEAAASFLSLIPRTPKSVTYGEVWPRVLGRHVVRKVELNRIAAEARVQKTVAFLDWAPGKRVPDDTYRMTRGPARSS